MKEIILINQYTGPLFIDVVNSFAETYHTTLVAGNIEKGRNIINPSVKVKKLYRYERRSSFQRLTSWIIFAIQSFFYLWTRKNKRLLLVTNPPFSPFVGYLLYKIRKQRYSLLVYDIYPDALLNFNYVSSQSLLFRIWTELNVKVFQSADEIFTISESMASELKKYADRKKDRIRVVPPWADNEFIKPVPKASNPFYKDRLQNYGLTVLYSGNMGITHDLETLLNVAIQLKYRREIAFLMVGDGAKKSALQRKATIARLENAFFLPFQPVEMLPYSLACGDLAVVALARGGGNLSVPSKTFAAMAAGSALLVIAEPQAEIASLVKNYDCGKAFMPGDAAGIAAFVEEMLHNPEKLDYYKENARKASGFFTRKNAGKFVDAFERRP